MRGLAGIRSSPVNWMRSSDCDRGTSHGRCLASSSGSSKAPRALDAACVARLLGTIRQRAGTRRTAARSPRDVSGAAWSAVGGRRLQSTINAPAAGNVQRKPPSTAEQRITVINQWVPAATQGDAIGDSARRRARSAQRDAGMTPQHYAALPDRRRAASTTCCRYADPGARARRPDDLPLRDPLADDERPVRIRSIPAACCSMQRGSRLPSVLRAIPRSSASPRSGGRRARRLLVGHRRSRPRRLGLQAGDELKGARIRSAPPCFPIAVDTARVHATGPPSISSSTCSTMEAGRRFLFVGRIAPNKEDRGPHPARRRSISVTSTPTTVSSSSAASDVALPRY